MRGFRFISMIIIFCALVYPAAAQDQDSGTPPSENDDDLIVVVRPTPSVETAGIYEDMPLTTIFGGRIYFSGQFIPGSDLKVLRDNRYQLIEGLTWMVPHPDYESQLQLNPKANLYFAGRPNSLTFVELAAEFGLNPYAKPYFDAARGIYVELDPFDRTGASWASGLPDINLAR